MALATIISAIRGDKPWYETLIDTITRSFRHTMKEFTGPTLHKVNALIVTAIALVGVGLLVIFGCKAYNNDIQHCLVVYGGCALIVDVAIMIICQKYTLPRE
jgi:hypothetical protein